MNGRFRLDIRRTQRAVRPWHSCPEKLWCPIPGGAQGQVGWSSGQPELVGGSPAHNTGLGLGGLWGPFQLKPSCDPMFYSENSQLCFKGPCLSRVGGFWSSPFSFLECFSSLLSNFSVWFCLAVFILVVNHGRCVLIGFELWSWVNYVQQRRKSF